MVDLKERELRKPEPNHDVVCLEAPQSPPLLPPLLPPPLYKQDSSSELDVQMELASGHTVPI